MCVKIAGGIVCALVVVAGLALTFIAKGSGEEFTRKHLQWTTNITLCENGDGEWTDPPIFAKTLLGQKPVFNCRKGHGHMLTPSNNSQVVNFACASDKLKKDLVEYNAKAGWKYVDFPSRRGKHGQKKVTIGAWWLPVKDPKAPRIVVQHGNNVNFNDRTVTVVAFLLRSMGFACILPNLRDHGTSDASDHSSVGWGYDYHLDTLAAWDYAVNDPDNKLGGAMGKEKVGLLGFSMGGFLASTAFGFEPDVPAAWVDSGVFNPGEVLASNMAEAGVGFASMPAWFFAKTAAGVDLTLHTPAKTLPQSQGKEKKKRPIAITHGMQDTTVPPSQSEGLYKLVKSLPDLYDVREYYKPSYDCKGKWQGKATSSKHCTMHIWRSDVYRQKLCSFWTHSFGLDKKFCGLDALPKYEENDVSSERRLSSEGQAQKTQEHVVV